MSRAVTFADASDTIFDTNAIDAAQAAALLDSLGRRGAGQKRDPATARVVVADVESTSTGRPISLLGEVRPVRQVTVYAKVSGYLKDVRVDRGDEVVKDQILGVVETLETDQEDNVAGAEYDLRRRDAKREQALSATDVTSPAELDHATARSSSRCAVTSARRQIVRHHFVRHFPA